MMKAALGDRASAQQAKSILEMKQDEARELSHDLIYIYHNRIDHAGDKMQSEGEAFEATERTFDDLLTIIKKLASYNASNVLITADHGFLYQNQALEENDFLAPDVKGTVHYNDRRFLMGKGLSGSSAFKVFSPAQLGLTGEVHAAIPKGTQRLRLRGSGSRFVHGGATLQEVIVPVITVNKSRQDDVAIVDGTAGQDYQIKGSFRYLVSSYLPTMAWPRELRCGI